VKWLAAFLLLLLPCSGLASPDLGTYEDVESVRVYRDHQKKDIWYLSPAPPAVTRAKGGSPDYGLDIYRYLGRKGTGDQALFWVKGILSVGITRYRDPKGPRKIRQFLKAKGVAGPRLRSMPVAGAQVRLLFADQGQSWYQGSRWGGDRLILPLDEHMAQVLWDAVHAGQTLVSVAVEERLAGLRWMEEQWQAALAHASWTLPIELDMKAYPGKFRRTDLGGRMARGYTGLDVFCFDFLEELDEDLYAKVVEVAIPTAGRDLVEEVTFRPHSPYRTRIEFELAKDLDRPYRVRITRILKDGRREVGEWTEKRGETLLDVTAYREPEEQSGDEEQAPR
jgi:hypothetical protein